MFSASHSAGLPWVVFQRKLAQTVAFNWLLQIQNVYSALRRTDDHGCGRDSRLLVSRGREAGCRAQVCSRRGAELRRNQARLEGSEEAPQALPRAMWGTQGSACRSRNQDPVWLNRAVCQIRNLKRRKQTPRQNVRRPSE